jgi:hypothetical protein
MSTYTCRFILDGEIVEQPYQAEWYYSAMSQHNEMLPNHKDQVVVWITPEGGRIHAHDQHA